MKIATAALAIVLLAGCASAQSQPNRPATPAAPATMTLLRACQVLRADMLANGGPADRATLARIAAEVQDVALSGDASSAEPDVGDSTLFWIDAAEMAHDCRPAGVTIPTSTP